jgi:hypothetical protein
MGADIVAMEIITAVREGRMGIFGGRLAVSKPTWTDTVFVRL